MKVGTRSLKPAPAQSRVDQELSHVDRVAVLATGQRFAHEVGLQPLGNVAVVDGVRVLHVLSPYQPLQCTWL
jgi:hypothetical protein